MQPSYLRIDVELSDDGEALALIELYFRRDVPQELRSSFGAADSRGLPARRMTGEHLFVLASRCEIRILRREAGAGDDEALDAYLALLPVEELGRV